MKKIISLIFVFVMLFTCTVPAMASEYLYVDKLYVDKNTIVADGDIECRFLAVDQKAILIVPKDATVNMNGSLNVLGTLMIQGKMTGEVSTYSCGETGKVILSDRGSASLLFSREEDAEKFASSVLKSNADVSKSGASVKVHPCLHAHISEQTVNATVCSRCDEILSYEALHTASTLSLGYPEIVFGVGGLAVGFIAAMLIFRKKKVAVSSTAADDEE